MGVLKAVWRWLPPVLMMSYKMEKKEKGRQVMTVAEVAEKWGRRMGWITWQECSNRAKAGVNYINTMQLEGSLKEN